MGGKEKYVVALNLQRAAFEIAKQHGLLHDFINNFSPDSNIGKYIDRKIREHHSKLKSVSIEDLGAARDVIEQLQATELRESSFSPVGRDTAQTPAGFIDRLSTEDQVDKEKITFAQFCEQFKKIFYLLIAMVLIK